MENKKKLLSVKDLVVKFRVRGRILTAIRGISLDIYENESIAIVGESGSGKSVFTKTFAGMLDSNGFIDEGSIIFDDDDLAEVNLDLNDKIRARIDAIQAKILADARLENGAATYQAMEALKAERAQRGTLSAEEEERYDQTIADLTFHRTELFNFRQTLDPRSQKSEIKAKKAEIAKLDSQIKAMKEEKEGKIRANAADLKNDTQYNQNYEARMAELQKRYAGECSADVSIETKQCCERLANEVWLSVARYPAAKQQKVIKALLENIRQAFMTGADLTDDAVCNEVFGKVTFRVRLLERTADKLLGRCNLNLAQIKYNRDWLNIRGSRIATVFQDPMTSLNPIITIGKQITSIIIKHQHCSEVEARIRALELMKKVGIPNAEKRFEDYPFEYSGGMRQRIVIAIALSCQPKILICDEPTTALDVTIQAQILKLLKDLQKEFGYTIVFITHDLGVVANIADRVAVLYAGQIVELGNVEEVFYDPRHPYTWALLSSLPQLAQRNTELYSIHGTPPSLYNKVIGDPFAPRNPYCMAIDKVKEPPMFQVTETHFAKTWLLDPRAPKAEKPEIIKDIHQKLIEAFNI